MIDATTSDNYKNINKVVILDNKKVFYPLKHQLQKRDISYDEDLAVIICPLPEDLKYPVASKVTDAGTIRDCKIEITINNQSSSTQDQLELMTNRKVIVILYYPEGKMIFGCNENPLEFLYNPDNSSKPQEDSGFTVLCRGNTYFTQVSL